MVLVWKVDLLVVLNSHSFGLILMRFGDYILNITVLRTWLWGQFLVIRKGYMYVYDRYFTHCFTTLSELKNKFKIFDSFFCPHHLFIYLFFLHFYKVWHWSWCGYVFHVYVCVYARVSVGVYCIPFIYFLFTWFCSIDFNCID